jgi:hypothetical protein
VLLAEVIDQSNHGFRVVGSEWVTGTRRPEGSGTLVGLDFLREVSTMVMFLRRSKEEDKGCNGADRSFGFVDTRQMV